MKKDFAEITVSARTAKEQFERAFKVYNFLKDHKNEQFQPKEIAEKVGYVFHWSNGEIEIEYSQVVKPLYWLKAMGLIDYAEYKGVPLQISYATRGKKPLYVIPTFKKWYAL